MAAGEGMREATDGTRVPLIVPDLHVVGPVILSLWLVPRGARVLAGDRVAELLAGAATIDLEAPLAGTLVRQFVDEDEPVVPGTVVAEIVSASGS